MLGSKGFCRTTRHYYELILWLFVSGLLTGKSAIFQAVVGDVLGGEMVAGGRRPEKALTAALVRSAGPGKWFDGHGLFLRVQPNGSRQGVQRIVVRGRRRELGLGSPPLVTPAQARERAIDNRRIARAGGDPLAIKHQSAAIPTFAEAVDRFLSSKLAEFKNDKHRTRWQAEGCSGFPVRDRTFSRPVCEIRWR
jgi:hypothetical protein